MPTHTLSLPRSAAIKEKEGSGDLNDGEALMGSLSGGIIHQMRSRAKEEKERLERFTSNLRHEPIATLHHNLGAALCMLVSVPGSTFAS